MAGQSKLRKILPDLLVIFIFLFLMASIVTIFYMILAWANVIGYIPALRGTADALNVRKTLPDTDGDGLPDVIETADPGVEVFVDLNGKEIQLGWGTGTDPNSKDTDGDLFTDALENKMGTDPFNWFLPGTIWIVWAITLAVVIYYRYFRKVDRVKEYIRAEEEIRSESTGGKYAVGGSSIFGKKKIEDLTEDERAQLVANDARFQQITGFNDVRPDQRITRSKKQKTIMRGIFSFIIALALWVAFFGF